MVKEITGPLFIPRLAELLAPLTPRQIVYLVRKREKELHEKIFLGGGKGSPLYLTIPLLSKYFPEFVDHRPHFTKLLKEHLTAIDHTHVDLKKVVISNRKTLNKVIGSGTYVREDSRGSVSHQRRNASHASAKVGGDHSGKVSKACQTGNRW
mgnify:CR=1 FL=1